MGFLIFSMISMEIHAVSMDDTGAVPGLIFMAH
jgi:hypothetical protein